MLTDIELVSNLNYLAGCVFIEIGDKIRFSDQFLNFEEIPETLNFIRIELKKLLGSVKFESLHKYSIEFDKNYSFRTYDEDEFNRRLPTKVIDGDILEFYSKFKFVVNYPESRAINDLFDDELKNNLRLTNIEIYSSIIQKRIYDWLISKMGTFLTKDKIIQMLDEITTSYKSIVLECQWSF